MPKIAVPELSRRDFIATTGPCFGQVFPSLVRVQTNAAHAKQFVRDLPTFLSSLPKPKYSIGQRVVEPFIVNDDLSSDNGLTYQNKGVVIGMWWNDETLEKPCVSFDVDFFYGWTGWVYVVNFLVLPRDPHLKQAVSPVLEDELQPWWDL